MAKYNIIVVQTRIWLMMEAPRIEMFIKVVVWNSVEGEISRSCAEIRVEHLDYCADTSKKSRKPYSIEDRGQIDHIRVGVWDWGLG